MQTQECTRCPAGLVEPQERTGEIVGVRGNIIAPASCRRLQSNSFSHALRFCSLMSMSTAAQARAVDTQTNCCFHPTQMLLCDIRRFRPILLVGLAWLASYPMVPCLVDIYIF